MKVYIAGPLFNESELERNRKIRDFVEVLGYETYLPQEDGGISYNVIDGGGPVEETRLAIFENDVEEIRKSDIVLCLLDGRVPDEGTCVELGIAFALGKKCLGYSTDQRSLDIYGQSLMIEGCLRATCKTLEELQEYLEILNA